MARTNKRFSSSHTQRTCLNSNQALSTTSLFINELSAGCWVNFCFTLNLPKVSQNWAIDYNLPLIKLLNDSDKNTVGGMPYTYYKK